MTQVKKYIASPSIKNPGYATAEHYTYITIIINMFIINKLGTYLPAKFQGFKLWETIYSFKLLTPIPLPLKGRVSENPFSEQSYIIRHLHKFKSLAVIIWFLQTVTFKLDGGDK